MSSEQRPLTALDAAADPDPEPEPPAVRTRDMEPENEQVCQNCGRHVTEQFRKVFGDNDNRVHACTSCADKFGSGRQFAGLQEIGGGR